MSGKECVAMLLAGGQGSRLKSLTKNVAKPAVIFGGKYRIIDFSLSNCYYSEIYTVGVLTQYKPLALNRYIGNGSAWALDKVNEGVYILPPYRDKKGGYWYGGTADAVYQNIEFVDMFNPEYVLILSGDHIYRMDYSKMLDFHKKKKADVTLAGIEVDPKEASRFGIMHTNGQERIIGFEEKPKQPNHNMASMGIYIFKWSILRDALIRDAKEVTSSHDFGKNIIPMLIEEQKKMYAYKFNGYWRDVGTIESYYKANMDLLNEEIEVNLSFDDLTIYSNKINSQPHFIGKSARISNSLICDRCFVEGTVDNSIISHDVIIGKNAIVKDAIILNKAVIEENAIIEKAIIGENVKIIKNSKIGSLSSSDITVVEEVGKELGA